MLLVQIIYVDDNNKLLRWKNSFLSIKKEDIFDILISGYVSPNYLEVVNDILRNTLSKIYSENYGKSYVINDIVKNTNYIEYIFMDSDIILEENTIEDLIDVFIKSQFDVLVPFQKGDSRHHYDNITESKIIDKYVIKWNKSYTPSFAGGIFITTRDVLKKNKFILFGNYGPEDTYFFKKLYDDNKSVGLVENIYVTHPFEIDKEYENYKLGVIKRWHKLKL